MKRFFFTLALFLILALPGFAAKINIPVEYYKLPNGLKVAISEDHSSPVVMVAVYYNTGFRIEPKGQTGFAHLFEHLMFQGSENVAKFEMVKYVEANGGFLNGHTDFDHTNYYEELAADRVETALWLEADRMRSLKVTEENLSNQKDVVMEEVRSNVMNQPYGLFQWIDLWGNANQNWHNSHNGYGDFTDLKAATTQMALDFYKTYYAPNNAALVVVGDVDTAAVKKMVEKHFTDIPSHELPKKPDITEPPQTKENRLQQKDKLAKVPAIAIGYHAAAQNTPDYQALVLLNQILEGDESSRLFQRLIKDKQVCLDWSGAVNLGGNDFDYYGPMLLTMYGRYKPNSTADEVVKNIDEVIADIQKNGVTEKELADAKVSFRSAFYDTLESHQSKAHLLAVLALFRDDPSLVNRLEEPYVKVTTADVKAAASKYLVSTNRTVIDRVPEQGGTN
ncbi:MAG TPA: pitrilysin family protein [Acidobacteriota bacterium]|nr:pitrilysin family protein [Acidobacteriota bacterium]